MLFCLRMDNVRHTQKGKTKPTTVHLLTWRLLLEIKYLSVFPLNSSIFVMKLSVPYIHTFVSLGKLAFKWPSRQ